MGNDPLDHPEIVNPNALPVGSWRARVPPPHHGSDRQNAGEGSFVAASLYEGVVADHNIAAEVAVISG